MCPDLSQMYAHPPEEMHAGGEAPHKYESHMTGGNFDSDPFPTYWNLKIINLMRV